MFVGGKDEAGKTIEQSLTTNVGRDRDGEIIWKADGARNLWHRQPEADQLVRPRSRLERRKGFRGPQDVDRPHGEWTRLDVIADKGHIEVFANGVKVNEAFDSQPQAGQIQLQTELAEVFFRKWELWPLGKGPAPALPAKQ